MGVVCLAICNFRVKMIQVKKRNNILQAKCNKTRMGDTILRAKLEKYAIKQM